MEDGHGVMENPFKREDFSPVEFWEANACVGKYGVPYLDRELLGISKSDLVVIGARSGAGKSSLAKIIFEANDKKKTALFSLENYDGDLEMSIMRRKYNSLTGDNYTSRQWQMMSYSQINEEMLVKAKLYVDEQLKNACIFGRRPPVEYGNAWNIESLTKMIIWCSTHGKELIIIDHLDYLDRDNANESDNEHVTKLMSAIREAQEQGAAIVAFSHLRKPVGRMDNVVIPNENEFIGSSNKIKQATQVIMFAPANDGDAETGYGTWCRICKNRNGGIKNQAAKMFFIPAKESYQPHYGIHTIDYAGTKPSTDPIETVF